MLVAICGTRGIPACYGGFETFAEELAVRLVAGGHRVRVYGRKHLIAQGLEDYRGVEIVLLPAWRHKYLETPTHMLACIFHLLRHRPEVVLVCNAANSPFLWLLRCFGIPTVVNVDGIERRRAKWNALGRAWYRLGERTSVMFADALVSDAEVIRRYYEEEYGASSSVIPYGADETLADQVADKLQGRLDPAQFREEQQFFAEIGVTPGQYLLYVSRLEPENNAHVVIEAYRNLHSDLPLVIVGDAPYAREYKERLYRSAPRGVVFTGFQFGRRYRLLQLGALVYLQATEVGGTHPALVEAMGFGNCCVANDTPENREVLADAGVFYRRNDHVQLAQLLRDVLADDDERQSMRQRAYNRAKSLYSWSEITRKYEALFALLVGKRTAASHRLPRRS